MSAHQIAAMRKGRRWGRAFVAAFALVSALVLLFLASRKPRSLVVATLSDAKAALADHEYDRAEKIATALVDDGTHLTDALAIAGEAAAKAGRLDAAIRHFQSLAQHQSRLRSPPLGLYFAGEACLSGGRLTEAEAFFYKFLSAAPGHLLTREKLAFLASVSGRRHESSPHYFFLVKSGRAEVHELVLFADLSRPNEQGPFLRDCDQKAPGDQLVQFGLANTAFEEGETDDAFARLETILSHSPQFLAGQAMLGELLVNQSDADFFEWHRQLPRDAETEPEIHYVRGLWARKSRESKVAARCFWETLRRVPTDRRATMLLGQQLRILNDPRFKVVENRAKQAIQLTQLLDQVLKKNTKESYQEVALLLEQMGRLWEAAAWGLAAERQFSNVPWARDIFSRVADQLTENLPLVTNAENLAVQLDLSDFPPFQSISTGIPEKASNAKTSRSTRVLFEEATDGPDFVYRNSADPATPGARMFEQTGGCVAVIDYDCDHWPDLFFSQGGEWRTGRSRPDFPPSDSDRLFRNVDGGEAIDVTLLAGLVDRGFGQGASTGDFDNDGFPDLYVANIGQNQLLQNNGDGTFSDHTEGAGLTAADWTTSCVMVDLNGDGYPDLFDVNYVTGEHVFEMICQGKACSPKVFAGAPDRLILSHGDGTFETTTPFPNEVNGKGLGVVAFELLDRGRPCLLIANDQVPNFLLVNRPAAQDDQIVLEDEALALGAAYNEDGLAMASMGIAADDLDGDGRIDFFISTFKDESSVLLFQDTAGLFVDRAKSAGLRSSTIPFVGWGTQCLDSELDGHSDIVVVNGHIDDYRAEGGEFHMRPQFFHNRGTGRFEEKMASDVGPFFEKKRLGRGLSRLDWNRDGLMDFAVSNIGERASLVMNKSTGTGHFVSVRLTARHGSRDAVGSQIEVQTSDRSWRKQLVAGDGYMASNERVVQFGVAEATKVHQLTVDWPSGSKTVLRNIPVDVTLELCEGSSTGVLRHSPVESEMIPVAVSSSKDEHKSR